MHIYTISRYLMSFGHSNKVRFLGGLLHSSFALIVNILKKKHVLKRRLSECFYDSILTTVVVVQCFFQLLNYYVVLGFAHQMWDPLTPRVS